MLRQLMGTSWRESTSQEGGRGPALWGQWVGTHKGCWTGRPAAWGLSGISCLSRSLSKGETAQTRGKRMCPGEVSRLPEGASSQSGGAPDLRPSAVAQSPGREAALAWASLSGCEGKLGVALESLQGLRDLT